MDFFKDKIVFPEMLKLLLLSFAWLGNSGMCVLVGGGRAVNRKHHPADRPTSIRKNMSLISDFVLLPKAI